MTAKESALRGTMQSIQHSYDDSSLAMHARANVGVM